MSRLPEQKRIAREDIPEADSWIEKLLYPLNRFMEATYALLNKGMTFEENITSRYFETKFTTASDYVANKTFEPVVFDKGFRKRAQGVTICQIILEGEIFTGSTALDWLEENGRIKIRFVGGLADSKTYTIKFLAF